MEDSVRPRPGSDSLQAPHKFWRIHMLTPEDKARIEEEERKAHAEEQYRAEVRSGLQDRASQPKSPRNVIAGVLVGLAVLIAIAFVSSHTSSPGAQDPAAGAVRSLLPTRY